MRELRSASLAATNSRRRIANDLGVETLQQRLEQGAVAEDEAAFEQGRPDGHVGLGLFQALIDRPRGVADLLLQVPQQIEHGLDQSLVAGAVLAAQQEQEIDVRAGRQRAAPVAADRDDAEMAGRRLRDGYI